IHLTAPHAPFLHDLAIGIVPKHCMTDQGLFPEGVLIGSGPFRFERRKGDAWVSLVAFEDHHNGPPSLNRVVFRTIRDDNARLLAMMGGSGQLLQNAVAPLLLPALQGDTNLVIESSPSFKYTYLGFNVTHPILSDVRVRQAIALGIDRDAIIDHKFSGLARPATGLLAPSHWAYTADVATWSHDPARARKLLDQAGYPDPDGPDGPQPRFEIVYKTTTNQFRRSIAQLIASQLADIGIAVKVQAYEWGTFFGDVKSGNFDLCSLQWPSVIEPDLYSWIFHSRSIPTADNRSSGANRGGYRNPTLDRLLDQARTEMDREARARLYHRVQAIVAEELPYISLWHEDNIVVRQHTVQHYQPVPNARFSGLTTTQWAR
ncbi:MAG: ABC transporter substrate-binding protein, partial [Myxococcota bacterium]